MNDVLFQLTSDFMAVGPAGSVYWTAVNPALAARLGLGSEDNAPALLAHPPDPSLLTARDGSYVAIDWTVHEEGGLAYWVGQERTTSLVRTLHHRLKNNLQFVISLLAFQAARLSDACSRAQFAKAESRVRAVARLHESNYASADFSEVEFGGYLRQLVRDLSAGEAPATSVDAAEVALPIEQAVPLGLIAHELISNALEHATASCIFVTLRYEPEGKLCLLVSVDGSGMACAPEGTGLDLVSLFVDQLQGTLHICECDGLHVSVTFPLNDE